MSIRERIEAFYLLHDGISYGAVESFADDIEQIARADERKQIAQEVRDSAHDYGPYFAPVSIDLAARILVRGGESDE